VSTIIEEGKFVRLMIRSNIDASSEDFMISDRVGNDAFGLFDVMNLGKSAITWGQLKDDFDAKLGFLW